MFLFSPRSSHTPRLEHGRLKFRCGNWRLQSACAWQGVSAALASSRSVSFRLPDTVTNWRGWKSSRATGPRGERDRKCRSLTRSRHTWEPTEEKLKPSSGSPCALKWSHHETGFIVLQKPLNIRTCSCAATLLLPLNLHTNHICKPFPETCFYSTL